MTKPAIDVARRSLCLELLFQRYLLEGDREASADELERARATWRAQLAPLGIEGEISDAERALLDAPVGGLSEDDLDDAHGRGAGALVLLWALGRLPVRPAMTAIEAIDEALATHGLLGDGAIKRARAETEAATLRPAAELEEGHRAYVRTRGKARDVEDPDRVFAEVAAHHLEWVLDDEMSFDDA
jgi:hypothetical protein